MAELKNSWLNSLINDHTLFYSVLVSWFCDSWMNISILGANEKKSD